MDSQLFLLVFIRYTMNSIYYINRMKKQVELRNDLNKCKKDKCNQTPVNKSKIEKAEEENKIKSRAIPRAIYSINKCSINNCKELELEYLKLRFENHLLFLKYTNRKLSDSKLNLVSDIKKLLRKPKKSNEDIMTTLKLIAKFYK